jgi:hypothetical protein
MCFKLSSNLHTNLDNRVENLKIRSRSDNCCESAKYLKQNGNKLIDLEINPRFEKHWTLKWTRCSIMLDIRVKELGMQQLI